MAESPPPSADPTPLAPLLETGARLEQIVAFVHGALQE